MRLQDRPKFRDGGAVRFTDFFSAARAVRAISQAGLYPSNCRILDPAEAYNTGAGDGSVAIMVLGFESGDHDVAPWMKRSRECCADHGGTLETTGAEGHREGEASARPSDAGDLAQKSFVVRHVLQHLEHADDVERRVRETLVLQ